MMRCLRNILRTNKQNEELEEIKNRIDLQFCTLSQNIEEVKNVLKPKSVPIDFKIVDPLDNNIELFSFEKLLEPTNGLNKIKIKNGKSILSNLVSSIPELTSAGLLANSYRFAYPSGFVGKVMQIGSGQGTAIMQNGRIAAHGTYLTNALVAVPLAALSIGTMLVRHHYLNNIYKELEYISSQLQLLVEFSKIEKQSKVRAITYFFTKALHEFDNVNSNLSYRNAMLTNIIAKNIEVFELIQFYSNSISSLRKRSPNPNEFEEYLKSFLNLQDLFLYGKMLAFMYSNLYDRDIQDDFLKEFKSMSNYYKEVLEFNSNMIQLQFDNNQKLWSDWIRGRQKNKDRIRNTATQDILTIDSLRRNVLDNLKNGEKLIKDVINEVEKPQEFTIDEGELYLIKN